MQTVLTIAAVIVVVFSTLVIAACMRMAGTVSEEDDARLLRELQAAFEAERQDRRDAA